MCIGLLMCPSHDMTLAGSIPCHNAGPRRGTITDVLSIDEHIGFSVWLNCVSLFALDSPAQKRILFTRVQSFSKQTLSNCEIELKLR